VISGFQRYFLSSEHYSLTVPSGGMFLFVFLPTLKGRYTSLEILEKIIEKGVAVIAGDDFYVPLVNERYPEVEVEEEMLRELVPSFRLSYAPVKEEILDIAMKKIAEALNPLF
jgi:DNA-binding transcriptional MocR family regulator